MVDETLGSVVPLTTLQPTFEGRNLGCTLLVGLLRSRLVAHQRFPTAPSPALALENSHRLGLGLSLQLVAHPLLCPKLEWLQ